jgi:hypothetical protein
MTTTPCTNIETAWQTYVFSDSSILDITPNAYSYPLTRQSEKEAEKFYSDTKINFFTYLVSVVISRQNSDTTLRTYSVNVTYCIEQDVDGTNWGLCRDAFETLYTVVHDALGPSWQNTVDFWRTPDVAAVIGPDLLDGRPIWKGEYTFTAEKFN